MKFRVTERGVAVASCLIVLLLSGWWFILDPISLLFEVLIIPHWHALGKTEPFAHGYYIMKISFGVVTVMISGAGICSIVGEYKREKQRDTQDRIGRELKEKEAALAHEKAENDRLRARVAELEKAPHKPTASGERGSVGSETASAKRIAEWKEAYIPAMVKAAIELGAEGPKPERERKQRKDIGALLDRFSVAGKALPSDHAEAVEVFRSSLPEGYVNTTGGAPKSKVTKIKQ